MSGECVTGNDEGRNHHRCTPRHRGDCCCEQCMEHTIPSMTQRAPKESVKPFDEPCQECCKCLPRFLCVVFRPNNPDATGSIGSGNEGCDTCYGQNVVGRIGRLDSVQYDWVTNSDWTAWNEANGITGTSEEDYAENPYPRKLHTWQGSMGWCNGDARSFKITMVREGECCYWRFQSEFLHMQPLDVYIPVRRHCVGFNTGSGTGSGTEPDVWKGTGSGSNVEGVGAGCGQPEFTLSVTLPRPFTIELCPDFFTETGSDIDRSCPRFPMCDGEIEIYAANGDTIMPTMCLVEPEPGTFRTDVTGTGDLEFSDCVTTESNLLHWWTFEDDLFDEVGGVEASGMTQVSTGGVANGSGRGAGSSITWDDAPPDWSVVIWVELESDTTTEVLWRLDSSGGLRLERHEDGGDLDIRLIDGVSTEYSSADGLDVATSGNGWCIFVYTQNSDGDWTLKAAPLASGAWTIDASGNFSNPGPASFDALWNGTTSAGQGAIDEVSVWSCILTDSDAAAFRDNGFTYDDLYTGGGFTPPGAFRVPESCTLVGTETGSTVYGSGSGSVEGDEICPPGKCRDDFCVALDHWDLVDVRCACLTDLCLGYADFNEPCTYRSPNPVKFVQIDPYDELLDREDTLGYWESDLECQQVGSGVGGRASGYAKIYLKRSIPGCPPNGLAWNGLTQCELLQITPGHCYVEGWVDEDPEVGAGRRLPITPTAIVLDHHGPVDDRYEWREKQWCDDLYIVHDFDPLCRLCWGPSKACDLPLKGIFFAYSQKSCGPCQPRLRCVECEGRRFPYKPEGGDDYIQLEGGLPVDLFVDLKLECSFDEYNDFSCEWTNYPMKILLDDLWSTENQLPQINMAAEENGACSEVFNVLDNTSEPTITLMCSDDRWYLGFAAPWIAISSTSGEGACGDFSIDVTPIMSCSPMYVQIRLCSITVDRGLFPTQLNPAFDCYGAGHYLCACDDAEPNWVRTDDDAENECTNGPSGSDPTPGLHCDPCEAQTEYGLPGDTAGCCDVCITVTIKENHGLSGTGSLPT